MERRYIAFARVELYVTHEVFDTLKEALEWLAAQPAADERYWVGGEVHGYVSAPPAAQDGDWLARLGDNGR